MNEFATSRIVADPVATADERCATVVPVPQGLPRDTLDAPEGSPRHRSQPDPAAASQVRLLSPQAAAKAVGDLSPGLEALLKLYKMLCDEPHATLADVDFHHWLSFSSLVPCAAAGELGASQPDLVLGAMEKTAQELSATWVRGRRMNEVVRFPCAPRRPTGADVPSDAVRALLDSHDYRLVAVCADGESDCAALFVAAVYALFDEDKERLVAGLERLAGHAASAGDPALDAGQEELTLWAQKVRAGQSLDPLLHGLRTAPASLRAMVAVLRSFAPPMRDPARALESLGRSVFGLNTTVVDSEQALGHDAEPGRALGQANTLYVLRTAEHFDALVAAHQVSS